MKRLAMVIAVCVYACCLSASAKEWVEYPGGDGPGARKHIVLASGDEEYRSEEALPMLGKILAVRHGFRCTVLFAINPEDGTIDPNNKSNIPGFERIAEADLVILFLRMRELPDEQMQHLVNHLNAGKPLLGLRTSTHAFEYARNKESKFARFDRNTNGGFGQEVLGETWVNHHGQHGKESARGLINGMHEAHPVLRGVRDIWGPTDVYGVKHLPDDANVLVYGQVLKGMKPDDPPNFEKSIMPIIWQRDYKADSGETANILCSTIGSGPDFECEDLRRVVVNFSYWSLGLADELPEKANVDYVGEYKPTYFGFDGAKKDVRPEDHELN
jgi:type 1 glutamine amidotransferase